MSKIENSNKVFSQKSCKNYFTRRMEVFYENISKKITYITLKKALNNKKIKYLGVFYVIIYI